MKLKPEHKAIFLMMGFIFAWLALFSMLYGFYEGLVEVTVNVVQGGPYRPYYLRGEKMIWWMVSMAISSLSLAIGLRAEEIP